MAVPGWVLRCLHQAAVGKSQKGAGQWGEAEPGGSCPSLPALPGRGATSSTGFCQALPGAGALPGTRGCSRREQSGIWDQQEALCRCPAGLTAPGVTGGNWAVSSERAPTAGDAPGAGSGLFFACRRWNKSHTSRDK